MYEESRSGSYIVGVLIVIVLIVFCWSCYDTHRNDEQYNNTDNGMERIEKRLDDIGKRVDELQKRNAEAQKTIERVVVTVDRSRENAEIVADGIGSAEQRLDNAIQISGRIKNRITDIEAKYRQGTQSSSQTDMAK